MSTYRGFSTVGNYKKFSLTDFELAQQDLINNFSIRKGEKLMQPNFGSIIWDLMFEPLDSTTTTLIKQDIQKIITYDPRLSVNSVIIDQQDTGFMIQLSLTYVNSDQTATLALNFDKNSKTLTTN
jgi:phage baseplate assembly protein W